MVGTYSPCMQDGVPHEGTELELRRCTRSVMLKSGADDDEAHTVTSKQANLGVVARGLLGNRVESGGYITS